ncbi:c-type cytochrome [Pannonibacter sp. Q-1]|uniref:Cytochrome C n=1 Tax=Pannonibacter phragmitetus TaxID=121719 RepID=A0A0U3PZA9_9HYPH|nr:cytochrome c [Pannonibacter phragmitetus]ALV29636.1 cytochrome C [Pannonibacter phragmitetus]
MLKKLALAGALVLGAGGLGFWALTAPASIEPVRLAALPEGNAGRGEAMFWAGGCASCHAAPGASGLDKLKLGGGLRLETPFGVFVAPNISPDIETGIGSWTLPDFANAMLAGISPEGEHYYPAFPYTSYARMKDQDISDLFAFLKTLEPVQGVAPGHELAFPFTLRRGLGLWKLMYLDPGPAVVLQRIDEQLQRGQYLVEGPGHCGECHTPRDMAGGLKLDQWLAGAKAPVGEGRIPNITGGERGIGDWSVSDIAYYLESGFTPSYDSVGGEMVAVQENMARLTAEDREAIAAYLKAIPAHAQGQ